MRRLLCALLLLGAAGFLSASPRQEAAQAPSKDDPEIRAIVDRFFATQVAEDAGAYLALWSARMQRPTAAQLKFIFDSGDDEFTDVAIAGVSQTGGRIVVRVFATRNRTDTRNRRADGSPIRYSTRLALALTLVREDGVLRIAGEGSPADTLATGILQAATAEARSALMDAEPDLVGEALIAALARSADAAARAGNFAAARSGYDIVIEVARRAGNRKAEGQALQNIGNAAYFQRDFSFALEAYRRRLAVEQDASNDEGVAESFVGIASVQYARFEYADALATFRQAAAIQERLGDRNALGTTLLSAGNLQFIQADYESALADYRRSRDLLHASFNFGSEARAAEGLGRTYAAQGDYAAALDAFAAVLAEVRAHGTEVLRGNATQNIGDVHFRLGNLEAARAAFVESRTHFEAAKDPPSIGRAWQALALTDLVATRFVEAEQEYVSSMTACASVDDRDCVARATVGLAFAQSSQEHFDEAIATYRKAIDAFARLNKPGEGARAEIGLSQAYLGRKDYEEARQAAARARQTAAGLAADDVLWRATTAEARAWRRLGSADRALAAAREAVSVVQRMAEYAVLNPSERVSPDTASAYAFLAVMLAETGDAPGALLTLERRRAHALRTAVAPAEREIWRGMTPEEREEERARSVAVASTYAQLQQERLLPRPDPVRVQALSARLTETVALRAAAQERIYSRLPDLRVWRGLADPPALDELIGALSPAATTLELAIDDDDVVAVAVIPGEAGPQNPRLGARRAAPGARRERGRPHGGTAPRCRRMAAGRGHCRGAASRTGDRRPRTCPRRPRDSGRGALARALRGAARGHGMGRRRDDDYLRRLAGLADRAAFRVRRHRGLRPAGGGAGDHTGESRTHPEHGARLDTALARGCATRGRAGAGAHRGGRRAEWQRRDRSGAARAAAGDGCPARRGPAAGQWRQPAVFARLSVGNRRRRRCERWCAGCS